MSHGDCDMSLATFCQGLVVFAVSTAAAQSSACPLDDPTVGKDVESFCIWMTIHNLQNPTTSSVRPIDENPVDAFGPDSLKSPARLFGFFQQRLRTMIVLNSRRMNNVSHHQPQRVDQQMTLEASDFLAGVEARVFSVSGGFRGLAVKNCSGWYFGTPRQQPQGAMERVVHSVPGPVPFPTLEIGVNRLPRRKVVRQHPPGTSRAFQVEDRIQHLAEILRSWPPARLGRREEWRQSNPLFIDKTCRIVFSKHFLNKKYIVSLNRYFYEPLASSQSQTRVSSRILRDTNQEVTLSNTLLERDCRS